jgi:hypothetical protein
MRKFRNRKTGKIAEYDSVMGLFYVEGEHYTDGPMVPYSLANLRNDEDWEELKEEEYPGLSSFLVNTQTGTLVIRKGVKLKESKITRWLKKLSKLFQK